MIQKRCLQMNLQTRTTPFTQRCFDRPLCVLYLYIYFSTLKDQLMFQGSYRNKRLLVLEKALLDIQSRWLTNVFQSLKMGLRQHQLIIFKRHCFILIYNKGTKSMPIFFVKIDASKKRCRGFSLTLIREIKIHVYAKRQTSDSS